MKKLILIMLAVLIVLVGCSTIDDLEEIDQQASYDYIIANIDNYAEISAYLEEEDGYGTDIDSEIRGGDSILMLAARYTTNKVVIKTILSYNPDINKENDKNGMTSLDYLIQRDGVDDIYDYLLKESYKTKVTEKAVTVKDSFLHNLANKF